MTTGLKALENEGGVEFDVIAKPKASRNEVVGVHNGALKVSVTAAQEKGRANDAIVEFLAKLLSVPKSSVSIVRGRHSRRKRIRAEGVGLEALLALIDSKST